MRKIVSVCVLILCAFLICSCAGRKKKSDFVIKDLSENRNGISAHIAFPVFPDYTELSRVIESFVAYDYDSFKKDVKEKNPGVEKDGEFSEYRLMGDPRVNEEYIFVEICVSKKIRGESESTKEQKIFLYRISDGAFLSAEEIDALPDFHI